MERSTLYKAEYDTADPSLLTDSKEGYSPKIHKTVKRYEFHFPNSNRAEKTPNLKSYREGSGDTTQILQK
jgi:Sec7-like guanine-nucleotide exchange factor